MEQFTASVEDAYEHLYDMVHLRKHPLARLLVPDATLSRKDRAWRLHHVLLEAIEELDPGSHAPTFSREWRRHRLMVLRYVDGLDPQAVADEIGIGRRHYYREQQSAIDAIASILWERRADVPAHEPPSETAPSRVELMRLEAARLARAGGSADLPDVLAGVLSLLQDRLHARQLQASTRLPEDLPQLAVPPNLVRQLLLATLSYLLERSQAATLSISAKAEGPQVQVTLGVEPPEAVHPTSATTNSERLAELAELEMLSSARLEPTRLGERVIGIELWLPAGPPRTVLVVDDNTDTIELYRRYLASHQYEVIAAETAREALDLARRVRPQAITLDVMMPDQDGWDLLQLLMADPETGAIPVVVCSVLRQKELALSLGAAAFLEKPISEEALLNALRSLE